MLKRGEIRFSKQTFGDFGQTIFGTPHPRVITATRGRVFGVTRQRIHSHPREFYEKLIVSVSDHLNPEEGHYLERLVAINFWILMQQTTAEFLNDISYFVK